MKRHAFLLLALLILTACPQVTSHFVPGAVGATESVVNKQNSGTDEAEAVSDDSPSEVPFPSSEEVTPPSDPMPSPGEASFAPPDVDEGHSEGKAGPGSDFYAVADPIDPKSDERVIDHPKQLYVDVRLQYGPDFENTLDPDATDFPDIPRDPDGKIHLSAEAQTKWHKHSDWVDSPKGDVVRMVYRPQDESSQTKYCDALISIDYSEEEGGNVLFSGVSAGPGRLDFYQLTPAFRKHVKESVNDTSDPIVPCESGWQKLDKERHLKFFWDFLGSFDSSPHE